MMSKKSFFNGTTFKKTIARFWPIWTAYFVIWFVALPLNALMMIRLDASSRPGINDEHLLSFAKNVVPELHNASLFFAVAFGALAAMAVLSHLYNARSANFFGALPIRREGLFLTHYLAGLAFLMVPNGVIFLLTLLIEAVGGGLYLPGLLFWLAVTCGECLFFYSMAVFCGMFTGHILALPAFYCIFNGLAYVLYFLVKEVFEAFYYGFVSFAEPVSAAMGWLSPALRLARDVRWAGNYHYEDGVVVNSQGLDVVAVYAVAAVVLTAAAFLLYRARRLESAGDVVSVKVMRPVFKYSVAVCSGLCLGMLTAQVVYMHEIGLMAAMLVWAVAGYFVAQMLLDKSFRVFRKWKGAAIVAAVFLAAYAVIGFDLTGFETRIPSADQVEAVVLDGSSGLYLSDDGDYFNIERSDPEYINYAIQLHRWAVDRRDQDQTGASAGVSMTLTYYLKNGSTLSREYTLWINPSQVDQEGSPAWVFSRMYQDRDLYWEIYGFEEADRRMAEEGYRLAEATFNGRFTDDDGVYPTYYYGKDAQALYEAVQEDFRADRIGVRVVSGADAGEKWGADVGNNLRFQFAAPAGWVWYVEIYVQDTATSTWGELMRLEQEGAGDSKRPASQPAWPDTVAEPETMSAVPTSEVTEVSG